MDPSWQPVTGAAQRRKGRRLRAAWRHEQQSIAQALAVFAHHSAPRRQETARAGGGPRVEVHGGVPGDAPPQAAGAQFFSLGDDDVEAPAAVRPAPLDEVRPQMGYKRHCGSGFELVLDVTVPQLGRELVEEPNVVSPVVEQNVHIPVRGGGRSKIPRGGVQGLRPGQGPTFQFFSPAPAVSQSPAPVVEYFSPAPAVFPATAPVIEYFSPAPAVVPATAPVEEFIPPAPAVFPATAPVEFISPVPAVFPATAPVVEYFSPAPAVSQATAPVEYFSPAPAVPQASSSVVAGGDSQGSVPGQSSAVRGGAVARGRRPEGPMPPLIAELFALGELPPEARTPRKRARMREIVSWLNGEG